MRQPEFNLKEYRALGSDAYYDKLQQEWDDYEQWLKAHPVEAKKAKAKQDKIDKAAIQRANKQRKKGPVPILTIPYEVKTAVKVILGKPIRRK
jgi:hypothetical protein